MNGFYKFKLLKAMRKEWKTLKFDGSLLLGRKLSQRERGTVSRIFAVCTLKPSWTKETGSL